MTDRGALYAACVACPDDDLPRLVFADWLDEHGEEEFAFTVRRMIYQWQWFTPEAASEQLKAKAVRPIPPPDVLRANEWLADHGDDEMNRLVPGCVARRAAGDYVWTTRLATPDRLPSYRHGTVTYVDESRSVVTVAWAGGLPSVVAGPPLDLAACLPRLVRHLPVRQVIPELVTFGHYPRRSPNRRYSTIVPLGGDEQLSGSFPSEAIGREWVGKTLLRRTRQGRTFAPAPFTTTEEDRCTS